MRRRTGDTVRAVWALALLVPMIAALGATTAGTEGGSRAAVAGAAADASVAIEDSSVGDIELETLNMAAPRVALMPAARRCPAPARGTPGTAPGRTSPGGVVGTTSADVAAFAKRFNEIRVARCLPPIPPKNIRYDRCMETRLLWIAEDPSPNPMSAWGHKNQVKRSDGLRDVGCDGNLSGGSGNTGATAAEKWWASPGHRASLYKPTRTGSTKNVCIYFAMTHGGVPNEPHSFTRAAARWVTCP